METEEVAEVEMESLGTRVAAEEEEEEGGGCSQTGLGSESQAFNRRRGRFSRNKSLEGIVLIDFDIILSKCWLGYR